MNKSEFQKRKKAIRALFEEGDIDVAKAEALDLVYELNNEKKYSLIAELYHSAFLQPKELLWVFEVAYALVMQHGQSDAEKIYEHIVEEEPKNSAALNNLSNIKKEKGEIDEAFDLIQRAHDIEPEDEIIARNYETLLSIVREKEEINQLYEHALSYLPRENEFVIQKLQAFFSSAKKDRDFKDNRMPIPRWKLKVMMGTDEQKALSLIDQWLNKGYVRKTGDRGDYNEHIYELNPLILKSISKLKPKKINSSWLKGIEQLNADTLEELGYFSLCDLVGRVRKSIRTVLKRDIDEMFLNYVMGNDKTVVILSGSIVEILLIYFCEKKKIKNISYQKNNKTISKKLYECDLGDLLSYFEQNRLLGDIVIHMGNISRIYRNFVHPGKELREQVVLDQTKANLCFMSTLEILNRVCT
jgi:tetratricopeptide (TPR) repeat protein